MDGWGWCWCADGAIVLFSSRALFGFFLKEGSSLIRDPDTGPVLIEKRVLFLMRSASGFS